MPIGEYTETIHYRFIKCDAVGCRTWRFYPLDAQEKGWHEEPVCAFGTTLRCCLCPDHRGELHRLTQRELNRHPRHAEQHLPKLLFKNAWDSIDAEAKALQLAEMCGVGHCLLNDGE